jgi:hypothetical protein
MMQTHWMTVEIDLAQIPPTLQLAIDAIESELCQFGEVHNWCLTHVDLQQQKAVVDAIIQLNADCRPND